jgi:hypothetical protein
VTLLLVANNALQGILSSFFFKYADTILKKYSSTVATIFTGEVFAEAVKTERQQQSQEQLFRLNMLLPCSLQVSIRMGTGAWRGASWLRKLQPQ